MDAIVVGAGEGTWAGRSPLVKAFGEHSDGAWAVVEGRLPPEADGPVFHVHHKHGEGFYIAEGTMTIVLADGEVEAPAGTYAYVPPGVPHTFKNRSSEPLRFVGICHPGIERFLVEMNEAMPPGGSPDLERLQEIAARYDSYPA
ncbi:MAG TPA: cupin domain-containing protein [Gaiellaceae bacterium]